MIEGIDPCSPRTVNVATHIKSRERTYLETFRREYTESLLPAHREVEEVYKGQGHRHSAFLDLPLSYEIDRFLNWAKLEFTTDETLPNFPLREPKDRVAFIRERISLWLAADMTVDRQRTTRLKKLRSLFATPDALESADFPEITDALLGCAAFDEQLRFTKGGQTALVKQFQQDNQLPRVKKAFHHLAFGSEDYVRRTYDCLYATDYKLAHFGRTCVLELYGWVNNDDIPPLNGRTIKALRYLGFDVKF